jgi:glycerol-3-phosphate acyltransferase PlsY
MGAIPVAYTIGRINGINVFQVGSRQAGATNIWREVSRKQGVIVTAIDAIKGVSAILIARYMGLEGTELLVPTAAAIAGHWNSPMTKFRGGDGVVTLMGASLGIAPITVFLGLTVGTITAVTMHKKLNHPSLWGGIVGFIVFITLSFRPDSNIDPAIVYGLTGLGVAIMLHSIYFHKRHKEYFNARERQREDLDATITQDRLS